VPFSAGTGECPGRNIVLLTASTMLAALLARHEVKLVGPTAIRDTTRLPITLDHTGLRISCHQRV
jgi:cytochrome P450